MFVHIIKPWDVIIFCWCHHLMTNVWTTLQSTRYPSECYYSEMETDFWVQFYASEIKDCFKRLSLINIYMYLFLQRLLSLNNSHVIAVIHFHFCSFNNSLKQETPLHSPHIYEHVTLCRQQVQVHLVQYLCSHICLTSADLLVLHLYLCRVRKDFHFCPSNPIFWV